MAMMAASVAPVSTNDICGDNFKVSITSGTKHVLLHTGIIEWKIEEFKLCVESPETLREQNYVYTISPNGLLPMMQYKLYLDNHQRDIFVPHSNNPYRGYSYKERCHKLKLEIQNDVEEFANGKYFYKVHSAILKENESLEKSRSEAPAATKKMENSRKIHHEFILPKDQEVRGDGSLFIAIQIEIFLKQCYVNQKPGTRHVKSEMLPEQYFQAKVISDFAKYLKSLDTTAIKIICKEGKEHDASMTILKARSEVFDAMFRAEMSESNNGIIKMDDLSSKAVTFLIEFIEKGTIATQSKSDLEDFAFLEEVIYAAEKYHLLDLLEYLNEAMGNFVNDQNALDLLKLANKFSLDKGKHTLKTYILKHPGALDHA